MNINPIEVLGYLASVVVPISLMMKNIIPLRVLNGIGCAMFAVYGLLIEAYPVAIMNSTVVFIHCYYLYEMNKNRS